MAKRQAELDNALQTIINRRENQSPKKDTIERYKRAIGVKLTKDELEQVELIAAELKFTRHAVLLYAIRLFLAGWQRGERPEVTEKTVRILKVK